MARARSGPRFVHAALALAAVAAALRLYRLDAPSLWADEIEQVTFGSPLDAIRRAAAHSGASPLDYLVVNAAAKLSRSDFVLRFPAMLFGVGSVFLAARLGRRLFRSSSVGLAAAALLAISPFHVRYSQEARFYSLGVFLILLSAEALAVAHARDRTRDWMLAAALLTLSFHAHVYTALLIAAAALSAGLSTWARPAEARARSRSRLRHLLLASGASALLLVPWLVYRRDAPAESHAFVPPSLTDVLTILADPYPVGSPLWGLARLVAQPALALLVLLGASAAIARRGSSFSALLPVAMVPVGILGALAIDRRFEYFFAPRQLLFVLPFYLMLMASGLVLVVERALRARPAAWPAGVAVGVLLVGHAQAPGYWAVTHGEREDWRRLSLFLRSAVDGRSAIVLDPETADLDTFLTFYQPSLRGHLAPLARLSFPLVPHPEDPPEWAQDGLERFWVVSRPGRERPAAASPLLNGIEVPGFRGIPLHYLGAADESTLATELLSLDLMPRRLFVELVRRRFGPDVERSVRFSQTGPREDFSGREACDLFTRAGRRLLDAGRLEPALVLLGEAVSRGPTDVEALNNLGLALIHAGRCAEAGAILQRSSRLYPDSVVARDLSASAARCGGFIPGPSGSR